MPESKATGGDALIAQANNRITLRLGDKVISCRRGDITVSTADAIVNAANNHLWMGSGVAGAIKRKGGEGIEAEAVRQGPINIGEVVATGAGRLKAKYVIHAAVMGQDLRTDAEFIRRATINALELAERLKLSSIDFPALGTGVGGFPIADCARLMITEALLFLKRSQHLKEVGFVLYDAQSWQTFGRVLDELSALA